MRHPTGYGREAYVWSLFAAFGLFVPSAPASRSCTGCRSCSRLEPAGLFGVSYAVLGIAFVLEGVSFLQALRQSRRRARESAKDVLEYVMDTSDPTLRAVFFEDAAALIGLVIAFSASCCAPAHRIAAPDAIGSILVGVLWPSSRSC
jgi:divalent metal cation (Fe/Co/Zn/Cd) transporter